VSPVERRIDDDLTSQPRIIDARPDLCDDTCTVRSWNNGEPKAGVGTLFDPDVAMIQRCGVKTDNDLAWGGMGIGDGVNSELLDASEDGSFHG
jgi:hypothetical protein